MFLTTSTVKSNLKKIERKMYVTIANRSKFLSNSFKYIYVSINFHLYINKGFGGGGLGICPALDKDFEIIVDIV